MYCTIFNGEGRTRVPFSAKYENRLYKLYVYQVSFFLADDSNNYIARVVVGHAVVYL